MMRQGLQPGSPFFTAQLQTALRLDDLPVGCSCRAEGLFGILFTCT